MFSHTGFYGMNICEPHSPNSHVENLIPNVMVLENESLLEVINYKGGACITGISGLIKRGPEKI